MMTINCKGNLINFNTPRVMGIVNLTPDSFYDGGRLKSDNDVLNQIEKMMKEGADFIDIGAYSSRPGADHISVEEEKQRLLPVLSLILKHFNEHIYISIDTFRSEIAEESVNIGAHIINDISAGNLDNKMFDCVAKLNVPYIMMHMKGTPQNMKKQSSYNDLWVDVKYYFSEKIKAARNKGITDLIIDPGFGFAKDIQQNFKILQHLELLKDFDVPLLCGISRKSMIYKTLDLIPDKALNGTTSLNTIALMKGASILRVHDVKEAVECVKLYKAIFC